MATPPAAKVWWKSTMPSPIWPRGVSPSKVAALITRFLSCKGPRAAASKVRRVGSVMGDLCGFRFHRWLSASLARRHGPNRLRMAEHLVGPDQRGEERRVGSPRHSLTLESDYPGPSSRPWDAAW